MLIMSSILIAINLAGLVLSSRSAYTTSHPIFLAYILGFTATIILLSGLICEVLHA